MKRAILLLLLVSTAASAQNQQASVGEWTLGLSPDKTPYAFVLNDSGNIFGQWCTSEDDTCRWMVATRDKCSEEAATPVVLNSKGGSIGAVLHCSGTVTLAGKKYYKMVLTEFAQVEKMVKENSRLGIAIPYIDEGFNVMRFNISGGAEAMRRMDVGKLIYYNHKSKNTTLDQKL